MQSAHCDLPDLNVWLAVFDANHANHERALRYWDEEAAPRIAFCGVSLMGLFRLATQSSVMRGKPFSPVEIWQAYEDYARLPEAAYLPEPPGLVGQMERWSRQNGFPVTGWTGCYLAATALLHGARLVSFDKDFKRFENLNFLHLSA